MKFECCLLAIRKTCWGSDTRVFRNVLPNRFGSRAFRSQAELELCGAPKQATCNTLPFAFMRLCPFGFVYGILLIKSPACRVVSSREAAAKGIGQGSNLESRRVVPQLLSWQHVARRLYTQYPAEVGAEHSSSPHLGSSVHPLITGEHLVYDILANIYQVTGYPKSTTFEQICQHHGWHYLS